MRLSATYRVPAPRERVFEALIDPAILQTCIEGCERLTETAPHTYDAQIRLGVGPLKGRYDGRARLRDLQPHESFLLHVEGKGGPGFVSGEAKMTLTAVDGQTDVACDVLGQVGGVIAAVGSRLIDAVAKQMLDRFFRALTNELTRG